MFRKIMHACAVKFVAIVFQSYDFFFQSRVLLKSMLNFTWLQDYQFYKTRISSLTNAIPRRISFHVKVALFNKCALWILQEDEWKIKSNHLCWQSTWWYSGERSRRFVLQGYLFNQLFTFIFSLIHF